MTPARRPARRARHAGRAPAAGAAAAAAAARVGLRGGRGAGRGRRSRAEIAYYLDHHLEGSDRGAARAPARPLRRGDAAALEPPGARPRDGAAGDARRRSSSPPTRTCCPALRELRERGLTRRGRQQLGLLAPGVARPDRDRSSWWTAWSPRPRSGAAKPSPRVFERALGLAGVEPGGGAARGRQGRQRHRRAPRRPGMRARAACSARAIRRRAWRRSARSPSCPPYSELVQHAASTRRPRLRPTAGAARGRRAALAARGTRAWASWSR